MKKKKYKFEIFDDFFSYNFIVGIADVNDWFDDRNITNRVISTRPNSYVVEIKCTEEEFALILLEAGEHIKWNKK